MIAQPRLLDQYFFGKEVYLMSYKKPDIKKIDVNVTVAKHADDQSSCNGGHCVKATYEKDPWG